MNSRAMTALLLVLLAIALAVNSLLGPQFADILSYPLSETLLNQTRGLELFSLIVLVPLCLVAAILTWQEHPAAAILAFAPAAYVVYMFAQYIVGPSYDYVPSFILFHLGIFILGLAVLLRSWHALTALPSLPRPAARRWSLVLVLLAAFVISRYLNVLPGGQPLPEEAIEDLAMFWTIFLLDLGIGLPIALATALGLWTGAAWGTPALYGLMGWFTLVPPSVATMGIVMLMNNDPYGAIGSVVVLSVGAAIFVILAIRLYLPLFQREP
jgi:hypothetical protein